MESTFLGRPVAGDRALIMAIVNRTPDSFYDRGATFTDEAAKEAAHRVIADGADGQSEHHRASESVSETERERLSVHTKGRHAAELMRQTRICR